MDTISTFILPGLFAVLPSSTVNEDKVPAKKDLIQTARSAGTLRTFLAALEASGLQKTINGRGAFTIFAPTDEAFAKLPVGAIEALMEPENRNLLVEFVNYHIVPGRVTSRMAGNLGEGTALNKKSISFSTEEKTLSLNGASRVVSGDLDCSNGIIHEVDTLLLPPQQ